MISISIFGSAYVINYFETLFSWRWAIAVISIVTLTIVLLNLRKFIEYNNNYSPEQIKKSRKDTSKQIVFYLLADAFYISFLVDSLTWKFVSGGLCMLIIYINLTEILLSGKIQHIFYLVHDFVVGVALTVYLIYIIPIENLQNIVSVVISALYGGVMTLVGVAWSIKDGQRRESESKRLETIPYLQANFDNWKTTDRYNTDIPDILSTMPHSGNEAVVVGGHNLKITNIGLGLATNLKCKWESGQIRNNHSLPFSLLQCNESFELNVMFDSIQNHSNHQKIQATLIFEFDDLLGNHYEQCLQIWLEVQPTTIIIPFYQMHAPKFIDRSFEMESI